jgi:hypothetical protein
VARHFTGLPAAVNRVDEIHAFAVGWRPVLHFPAARSMCMARDYFKAILLGLLLAGSVTAPVSAVQAASKSAAKVIKVSTLGGKFGFSLPEGYKAEELPAGNSENGTAGAKGTMYMHQQQRRVVIVTQMPVPNGETATDNDDAFLAGALAGFEQQQSAALPDYKKLDEKSLTLKKLGVRQIDSSATMGGGRTLATTFVAASGKQMALVQVISRADDEKGHAAMVKRITGRK